MLGVGRGTELIRAAFFPLVCPKVDKWDEEWDCIPLTKKKSADRYDPRTKARE